MRTLSTQESLVIKKGRLSVSRSQLADDMRTLSTQESVVINFGGSGGSSSFDNAVIDSGMKTKDFDDAMETLTDKNSVKILFLFLFCFWGSKGRSKNGGNCWILLLFVTMQLWFWLSVCVCVCRFKTCGQCFCFFICVKIFVLSLFFFLGDQENVIDGIENALVDFCRPLGHSYWYYHHLTVQGRFK